jgi:acyl-CoA thioester hydrolase
VRAPEFKTTPLADDPRYVRDSAGGLVWHRVPYRVLFADTDRTGVVYHANYFRFFELGRATLLRDSGFPLRQLESEGYGYPICQLGLDFFRPVDYDAPILVHTRFRDLHGVRVDFAYLITHAETGAVLCQGFTRHAAVNRKGRPVAVDPVTVGIYQRFPT